MYKAIFFHGNLVWTYACIKVCIVLPSCAVCCIRGHFPPQNNEHDFVFKGFRLAEE